MGNQKWLQCHQELQLIFSEIWQIVRRVLCADSPEGQSFFEEEVGMEIGIKDTLSYSWRALKESRHVLPYH